MGDSKPVNGDVSIMEQLGKAFIELKSHEENSENKVQWKEIEEYFHNYEKLLKTKSSELEEKRKAFEEKESEIRRLIAEREEVVAAKELDMLDRIQEVKDSAVALIMEAQEKYKLTTPDSVDVDEGGNKVCNSLNDDDPDALYDAEESSPYKSGEHAGAVDVQPRQELMQFCEQMDAKGLLNFIMENQKNFVAIRREIPIALKCASDPAQFVLDSLEGFYPSDQTIPEGNRRDAAFQGMCRSCVMLLESVAPFLFGAEESGSDHPLNPETKERAKAIADEWKPKLVEAGIDAANGNSLEADAFLQLLVSFRISSEFEEDELCKIVLAIARRRQAPELCRSLGITHKIPGIVEALINSGKQVEAVHFIQAFNLAEIFPPVPLLKTYLKDLRRNTQGKPGNAGSGGTQNNGNAQEFAALKAVIKCVVEYNLEGEYPLEPLQKRAAQLEKAKGTDKKRVGESAKHHQPKKARTNGGYYGYRNPSVAAFSRKAPPAAVYSGVEAYIGASERYPHAGSSTFVYQAPNQGMYGQAEAAQRSYYYAQDDRVTAPAAAAAATYNSGASSYDAYMSGSGLQSSHQSFI
ncbi:hypothetical protein Sjap_022709 [Stephania japonica]|uniref:FRIGIDA-like protein n=1 Tax=Stephania japonica TaxID=461633 RepID=A0AAP0HTW5_9MAGN